MIRESVIERHLVNGVKKLGGLCYKFTSPGSAGVPDRIVITATGQVLFAELKADDGRLSKIQRHVITQMRCRGAEVWVLYGLKDVKRFLTTIEQRKSEVMPDEVHSASVPAVLH